VKAKKPKAKAKAKVKDKSQAKGKEETETIADGNTKLKAEEVESVVKAQKEARRRDKEQAKLKQILAESTKKAKPKAKAKAKGKDETKSIADAKPKLKGDEVEFLVLAQEEARRRDKEQAQLKQRLTESTKKVKAQGEAKTAAEEIGEKTQVVSSPTKKGGELTDLAKVDLNTLTVKQLRALLKERELKQYGNKKQLIKRLQRISAE